VESESTYFAIAFVSGLVPALFWLWFWLREDREKPEPYLLIALAFIGGMMVVPLALPMQKLACELYNNGICQPATFNLVFIWVIIEELLKYAAALVMILWNKAVDEPIDVIIYMITIALGFASLENALFIFNPLTVGDYINSAHTGFFRFLGPTLLHVLASGTVGAMLALSFFKKKSVKLMYGSFGLFIAVVLHALFNFFIMDASGETILGVFLFVWIGVIALFLIFEKVKILEARHNATHKH
jgi:RsiW-degrading membrane proteinase PrsW (M82 family)